MENKTDVTYETFADRIPAPVTPEPEEEIAPLSGETRVLGKGVPRVDGYERVSGDAQYSQDVYPAGMLHAAILRCPHAHAMVKSVDTSAAERMPGVHAVISADSPEADMAWPHATWITGIPNQSRLFDRHCRHAGEVVAAVAAETPHQAYDALKAIRVEYELLPTVLDAESAMDPSAPQLHEEGNKTLPPNANYSRGDTAAGFEEADYVLEESFSTGTQSHATMETHGSIVKWEGDKLTIWEPVQGVFAAAKYTADALRIPLNNIRVVSKYMGGAFGSKAQIEKHTVIGILLARMTGRPVRTFLPREDDIVCCGYRPESNATIKAGVKRDGTLTALSLLNHGTCGAYYEWTAIYYQMAELYECPNVHADEWTYYSNTPVSRPFRAPGFPTCSWTLEQMIDMLAERIGMDPLEFRLKNIADWSQGYNQPYTSCGLRECLIEGAKAFGWAEARKRKKGSGHLRRGVGVACGIWAGGGGPPVTAIVRMLVDGSVVLSTGAMDIGTGTKTVACMTAAEELNVPIKQVKIENADTDTTPYCVPSGGSRTLPSLIPAVRRAAWHVKQQLLAMGAEEFGLPESELEFRDGLVFSKSDPRTSKPAAELIAGHNRWDVAGVGYRAPNPEGKAIRTFAAHFTEVEVNILTGEVHVVRMVGANESGRVINRKTFDNQVVGGMAQGIGYGVHEQRIVDRQTGKLCTSNLLNSRIPTALDVPFDHDVVAIDPEDRECNIVGCKGLGEPATIPTAASVANAIYDAVGVRIKHGPANIRQITAELSKR